jgi:hypothetical protein
MTARRRQPRQDVKDGTLIKKGPAEHAGRKWIGRRKAEEDRQNKTDSTRQEIWTG